MGGLFSKKGGADLQRVIVVFGATGAQGGSVLRALVEDQSFLVRAVTRNPESDKAKALAELGVDVVKADVDDMESVKTAMKGAYGVFAVTSYWESMDKEKETQQGKRLVDAAIACDVKHFVYSGLDAVSSVLGKECPFFDAKATVVEYIKEKGIAHTIAKCAFYYENFLTLAKPVKNEEDIYILEIPIGNAGLHMICVNECGECIHNIFKDSKKYMGKEIHLTYDQVTSQEIIDTFSKHFPDRQFALGTKSTDDMGILGVMYEYISTDKYIQAQDPKITRKLNAKIPKFDEWVESHKDVITAACD